VRKSRPYTPAKLKTEPFQFIALSANDIETLRLWRNHPHNAAWFEVNKIITAEDQLKWFENLDPTKQRYFSFFVKGTLVAFFHLKQINWPEKTAECGLITNPEIQTGLGFTLPGSLELLRCAFDELDLQQLCAKVKATNKVAIAYNKALGFELLAKENNEAFCWMKLERSQFEIKRKQLEALCLHVG
jgi:RimJ/RimL family protein N-acetyltransferase